MSTTELPPTIPISQPHSPYEDQQYGALQVPSIHVEKFKAVIALVEAEVESEVPSRLVAAVTVDDCSHVPHEELAYRVRRLVSADEYVREHPGEPFVNANRPSLTAGIIDDNEGIVVAPWHTSLSYGTGLAIPSRRGVKIDFFSNDRDKFMRPNRKVPADGHMKFITPDLVTLGGKETGIVNVHERMLQGGILAVGEEAVSRFFLELNNRKLQKAAARTIGLKH